MRVLAVAFVLILLLLAGCSSAPPATTSSSSGSLSSSSSAPAPKPVPPTDTLHFTVAPDVVLFAPKASEPNQTELPASGFGGFGGGQTGAQWEYPLAANETFGAYEAHIFVRVVDQLVAPPDAGTLCSWSLQVSVGQAGGQGGPPQVQYPLSCSGPSGPTIAPGDYELIFTTDGPTQTTEVGPGDVVQFRLARTGTSPTPTTSVYVLTGAKSFDSRITFTGFKEPVTPA